VLGADRKLQHERGRVEALDHHVDALEEVGTRAVELVDEAHARYGVLVGLAPHRHGLRLYTGNTVEHRDSAVEDAQRALDLGREVHVAGGVDDVDLVALPPAGRRGRRDGDAALLLLLHPVHGGRALVDLTDLVVDTGVEEDALSGGGLAGVDVRHDADVADLGQVGGDVDSHVVLFLLSQNSVVGECHWDEVRRPAHPRTSPAVVSEGLVGLGHLVGVLAALHSGTKAVGGVEDLVHEALGHRLLAASLRVAHEPAQ